MTAVRATQADRVSREGFASDLAASARPRFHVRLVESLLLAGGATLFLAAAGTIDVGYTVRPFYGLLALACALGLRIVAAGWRTVPIPVAIAAGAVLACYGVATALGKTDVVAGETRAGQLRSVVYLTDLAIGIAVLGLVVGLSTRPRLIRLVVVAIVAGGALGAIYAAYQWVALHFGWPLSHVNNTADSSGLTRGASQGDGILGWERARGTFLEPHFLAGYLASVIPLGAALVATTRGARRIAAGVATSVMVLALVTTSSFPAWTLLAITAIAGAAIVATVKGRRVAAVTAAVLLVAFIATIPIAFLSPSTAATLTGRPTSEIEATTSFRTDTWERVGDLWAARPIFGYGPGQSSVQLTIEGETSRHYTLGPAEGAAPLESAQGLWAASLIDVGVIGLGLWILFLGTILAGALQAVLRLRTMLAVGLFLAALAAIMESQISGDRLELRVWLLLGLVLALANERRKADQH